MQQITPKHPHLKRRSIRWLALLTVAVFTSAYGGLTAMDDEEMSEISGKALLDLDKYNHPTAGINNNFYKITMNSEVTTSINMDKLVLRDSLGNVQIDIDNFSLNGGDNSNSNAAVSSARLTNPFIEFAFDGDIASDNAQNRKIIGIRFGAEDINGYLSLGNQDPIPAQGLAGERGINMFTGYMKTADITATASTLDSGGGTETDLAKVSGYRGTFDVTGKVDVVNAGSCPWYQYLICAGLTAIDNDPFDADIDMKFPSVTMPVTIPGIEINAKTPISSYPITAKGIKVPPLGFEAVGGGTISLGGWLPIPIDLESDGQVEKGLFIDATIDQELRYIHKVNVGGGAFYMSAQNQPIHWKGAPVADVAQKGWWMSMGNPVELGKLALSDIYLTDTVLQDVTDRISDAITSPPIQVQAVAVINGLGPGTPTYVPMGKLDLTGSAAVPFSMTSQNLGAVQQEVRNCWNGALGC